MTEVTDPQDGARKPLSNGRRILIGLLLGLCCGLFIGDLCAPLQVVGQSYVGLLQMTVLPYLVATLICQLGRLDRALANRVGVQTILVQLLLWSIGVFLIVISPLMLPRVPGAAFYSPALESPEHHWQSVLNRFIPTNIFGSLADESVPAVVVFCLFFGGSLLFLPGKKTLLDALELCSTALKQINFFLIRLAPLGLFALTAAAAGTLHLEELSRLQAYLIVLAITASFAAFGVLPLLVSSLTPIRYRDFFRAMQEPLLIAIATGKLLVTLPQITQKCDELLRESGAGNRECNSSIANVLVPLAYPFPHLGKTLAFVFIAFAAWYTGHPLQFAQAAKVGVTGTIASFASPLVTIPSLLNEYQLPQDLMSLFLLPGFITTRIGDVVGVAHLMALTVIVGYCLRSGLIVRWRQLILASMALLMCLALLVGTGRWYLASTTLDYDLDTQFLSLDIPDPHDDVVVYSDRDSLPDRSPNGRSAIQRLRQERSIRVGYLPDAMPYCFLNRDNQLVGLDVELFHRLAQRMRIRLQFVPCSVQSAEQQLQSEEIDVLIGGVMLTPERLLRLKFTQPYQSATLAIVARDHRRSDFHNWEQLASTSGLRLATNHSDITTAAKYYLPDAQIEEIESPRSFFNSDDQADGILMSAEVGSVWTILYPEHTVVVPQPILRRPVCFAVRSDDTDWLQFLDRWLEFEKSDRTIERLTQYWVQGGGTKIKPPRWCIARDVLHWLP